MKAPTAFLLALGLLTGLLPRPVLAAEAKEVRIALQPTPNYGPAFVVKAKGWLEESLKPLGVTVSWSSFPSGPPMNEALAAGNQDIGFMGDTPAIIARSAGQDTRIVGLSATGPKALAVIVPQHSPITSPGELKGKKVAVVKGSYAHHLLVLVLKSAGLTVSDIELINLPHADIPVALDNGEIDAGCVWEPLVTRLTDGGPDRVLADGTGRKLGILVIVARNGFAEKNPDVIAAFLQTLKRGQQFIREHPEEAAGLISKEVNLPPVQLVKVLANLDFDPSIKPQTIEELTNVEAFLRTSGIIKNPVEIGSFVDTRYLKQAGIE